MAKNTDRKKMVMLTLAKTFPVKHSQVGKPTKFEANILRGKKIHTVRGNRSELWDKRAQEIASGRKYLSVREWTGRPYNSEQRVLAEYHKIGLQHITIANSSSDAEPQCWVDDKKVPIYEIAQNDGLAVDDFVEWFLTGTNVFQGVIIHFTDFRY